MTESFAREVDLTIAVAGGLAESEARRVATEQVVPEVLDALDAELARLLGDSAIVSIRNLQFDCSVDVDSPQFAVQTRRIGEDLAAAIANSAPAFESGSIDITRDRDWFISPSLGDFLGSALVAHSQGTPAPSWPFGAFDDAESVAGRLENCGFADLHAARTRIAALSGDTQLFDSRESLVRLLGEESTQRLFPPLEPTQREENRTRRATEMQDGPNSAAFPPPSEGATAIEAAQNATERDHHAPLETAIRRTRQEPEDADERAREKDPETRHPSEPADATFPAERPPSESLLTTSQTATRMAGLAFLIRPILELGIAEHLWAAGLIETEWLAEIALAIVGDVRTTSHLSDPSLRLLFGMPAPSERANPQVWAKEEIQEKTLEALASVASGALAAELARTLTEKPLAPGLAVAISALVNHRRRRDPFSPLAEILELRGTLKTFEDEIVLTLDAAAIDLDLRRAGIDHNPGFVPWLGKKLTISYRGLEVL